MGSSNCSMGDSLRDISVRLGTPFSRSYDVRLDDGTSKSYAYWFADLREA